MSRRTLENTAPISDTMPGPVSSRHAAPASALKWQRASKAALVQVKEDATRLKAACPDSDMCVVLGMYDSPMSRFTDGFQNLHYLAQCRRLGAPSSNGFVFGMTFLRKGYKTYAVLKSSRDLGSDNLMYEYRIGLFLNTKLRHLPNFVATYAAFTYTSADAWQTMVAAHEKNTALSPDQVRSALRSVPFDMEMGCRDDHTYAPQSVRVAILVQNLPAPLSLQQLLDRRETADLTVVANLLPVLFQVYFALDTLRDEYTHYDLHANNVLLYEPSAGRHVAFVYHLRSGETLRFRSRYIAKIIDYGRSFFKDAATDDSSKKIQQSVPAPCGGLWSFAHYLRRRAYFNPGQEDGSDDDSDDSAYGLFARSASANKPTVADRFYIDSDNRNHSHDLRLLRQTQADIMAAVNDFRGCTALSDNDAMALTLPVGKLCSAGVQFASRHGTPESESCSEGLADGTTICTVTDAAALLRRCLQKQAPVAYRLCFDTPLLGTLTVHESGANFEWDPAGLAGGKAGTQEFPRRGARQPQAKAGQTKVKAGQTKAKAGQTKAKAGQTKAKAGQTKAKAGQTKAKARNIGRSKTGPRDVTTSRARTVRHSQARRQSSKTPRHATAKAGPHVRARTKSSPNMRATAGSGGAHRGAPCGVSLTQQTLT